MGSFFLYPFSLLWKPQKMVSERRRFVGPVPRFLTSKAMSAVAATQRPGAMNSSDFLKSSDSHCFPYFPWLLMIDFVWNHVFS